MTDNWQTTFSNAFPWKEFCILVQISLKFFSVVPTENDPTLVPVMAWWQTGDNPVPELMTTQGLYSLSGWTSYRKISWSLEVARFGVKMIASLWNLTDISVALLPMCLSNFKAIGKVWTWISRLRDFTRSCGKTPVRLVYRRQDYWLPHI